MSFHLELYKNGETLFIRVAGRVVLDECERFKQACVPLVQPGVKKVAVEMAGVEFIDSAGLGVLVGLKMTSNKAKARMSIIAPSRSVADILYVSKLDGIFDVVTGPPADVIRQENCDPDYRIAAPGESAPPPAPPMPPAGASPMASSPGPSLSAPAPPAMPGGSFSTPPSLPGAASPPPPPSMHAPVQSPTFAPPPPPPGMGGGSPRFEPPSMSPPSMGPPSMSPPQQQGPGSIQPLGGSVPGGFSAPPPPPPPPSMGGGSPGLPNIQPLGGAPGAHPPGMGSRNAPPDISAARPRGDLPSLDADNLAPQPGLISPLGSSSLSPPSASGAPPAQQLPASGAGGMNDSFGPPMGDPSLMGGPMGMPEPASSVGNDPTGLLGDLPLPSGDGPGLLGVGGADLSDFLPGDDLLMGGSLEPAAPSPSAQGGSAGFAPPKKQSTTDERSIRELVELHCSRAFEHMRQGSYEESVKEYRRALEFDAEHLPALNNLAIVYEKKPSWHTQAILQWEKVENISAAKGDAKHRERAQKHLANLRKMNSI